MHTFLYQGQLAITNDTLPRAEITITPLNFSQGYLNNEEPTLIHGGCIALPHINGVFWYTDHHKLAARNLPLASAAADECALIYGGTWGVYEAYDNEANPIYIICSAWDTTDYPAITEFYRTNT